MKGADVAWRGFVDHDGGVVAWPTLLATHNDFHLLFGTTDGDFSSRWRQWSPREEPDFDGRPTEEVRTAVYEFLGLL